MIVLSGVGDPSIGRPLRLIGVVFLASGIAVIIAAAADLGRSLTVLPAPKDDATLRTDGLYGVVRHPIYAGVIVAAVGAAYAGGRPLALVPAVVLVILLDRKASYEERLLVERFPDYEAYRQRVRKLVPGFW